MMPVVAGERATRRQILLYALVLLPVAIAPWLVGGAGAFYGGAALVLSLSFLALTLPVAFRVQAEEDAMLPEKRLFGFSIVYLFALFAALVADRVRSEEHTSELQSLMRISYAVFCLKKKKHINI